MPSLSSFVALLSRQLVPPADPAAKGRYDRLIDAANRLPRPLLVFGVVGLLALALFDPVLFDRAMSSLNRMPHELWWLIAAVLAGHFGAREAHHLRDRTGRKTQAKPPQDITPDGKG